MKTSDTEKVWCQVIKQKLSASYIVVVQYIVDENRKPSLQLRIYG